jgi:UDP-N-acetylglucosamine 1-carboxyvinyltransferase
MDRFVIDGGTPLNGTVDTPGVKNVILPMICAALMADRGTTIIHRVPDLQDIRVLRMLLEELGAVTSFDPETRALSINAENITKTVAPYELVKQMRASFLLSGALLGRFGEFHISHPGGCAIGARPVNFHLVGFKKLGARVVEQEGLLSATVEHLTGATVCLDYPSHTGTENLMMVGALAEGTTIIENAACEPEIVDFGDFLNAMGAKVTGHGTPTIAVEGVDRLDAVDYTPITDRIVAGTMLCAAAVTAGELTIRDAREDHLRMVISKLRDMGAIIERGNGGDIVVKGPERLSAVDITSMPHPGFPTDLQPPITACLAVADGVSFVWETVFENRFTHAAELVRMGANIRVAGDKAVIVGTPSLIGAPIMASDIRAGAALVLAGLAAHGTTIVDRVYHIDRGYEHIENTFTALGGTIRRETDNG